MAVEGEGPSSARFETREPAPDDLRGQAGN
jgi:hypothetical protein